MSSIEERRELKGKTPKIYLELRHVEHARLVPTREHMIELLPKRGVVAEVGVAFGDFTREIINRANPMKLHLVDTWDSERYLKGLESIKNNFSDKIISNQIEINEGTSINVLETYMDAYFDWIYIDTDHSYMTTREELAISAKKVKPNGHITGHDFTSGNSVTPWPYGVIEACNEFCVNEGWEYEFLTMEPHGHMSFSLKRLKK